jgi:undecaprenyl-diphosphatase
MLERELHWERDWFFALNGSDSAFWDAFFWLYSEMWIWIPFYLCVLFCVIYRRPVREILLTIAALVLVVVLCDQISSGFFKPFFHRFRPTHHPDFKELVDIVYGYRGGRYGFTSSHAANTFGFAVFSSLLFRHRIYTFTALLFAFLTAYSRVYLGVHFISDVAVGALTGVVVGAGIYYLATLKNIWKIKFSPYSLREMRFLAGFYAFMLLFMLIIAKNDWIISEYLLS